MADRKISDLTALTTPATGDLIPIVDISEAAAADKNKSITVQELFKGVPDGTAAAPGLAFESDDGNGIYKPGTDQVAISTGGTGRLFVDASGNVGVATSSPSLNNFLTAIGGTSATGQHIAAAAANRAAVLRLSGGTQGEFYVGSLQGGYLWNRANHPIHFATNNTERARIDSSGRLLVGLSSWSGDESFAAARSSGSGQIALVRKTFTSSGGVPIGFLNFKDIDGNHYAEIASYTDGTGTTGTDTPGRLVFSTTADAAASPTERMRIDSSGRVGIGTTSPGAPLHVVGPNEAFKVQAVTNNDCDAVVQCGGTNVYSNLRLRNSDGTRQCNVFSHSGTTLFLDSSNGGGVYLRGQGTGSFISFNTEGTEKARIDSSGRVGIGTSSPAIDLEIISSSAAGGLRVRAATALNPRIVLGVTDVANSDWAISNRSGNLCLEGGSVGGNVGIGTTSPGSKLDILNGSDAAVIATINGADTSSEYLGLGIAGGEAIITAGGNGSTSNALVFRTASSGTESERARIDSSGRLLVGTSTSRSVENNEKRLQVEGTNHPTSSMSLTRNSNDASGPSVAIAKTRGTTAGSNTIVQANDNLGYVAFAGADGTDLNTPAAYISCFVDGTPGANDMPGRLVFSTTADGASSPTEAVRINSSQNLVIGGTDTGGKVNITRSGVIARLNTASTSNTAVQFVYNGSTEVGRITTTTTTTAYNTSSDYRLKENVVAVTDGIARLQQLKPSRFNFIADPSKTVDGFLAHEAQTVVPEAVTGTHDEVDDEGNPVYQGIDQSKLVPLLTAALQEAIGEIESLKARVAALEAN